MKKDTITLAGETYTIGFSFRAIKNFEEQTGRPVTSIATTYDNVIYLYCTLKALNPDTFKMTFDEFDTALSDEPEVFIQFVQKSNEPSPRAASKPVKKKLSKKLLFGLWMLSPLLVVSPVLIPIFFTIVWIWTSLKLLARLIAKVGKKRGSKLPHQAQK